MEYNMNDIINMCQTNFDPILNLENIKIKTLPPIFSTFHWVDEIVLKNCGLENLNNLPCKVKKVTAPKNNIMCVGNLPETITDLNLSANSLDSFNMNNECKNIENLRKLKLGHNKLNENTINIPDTVIYLDISLNEFNSLPNLHKIKYIDVSNNNLTMIDNLPESCVKFICMNNKIEKFVLPNKLRELYADFNAIEQLPILPQSLNKLNVSNNKIIICPLLPPNCSLCDISSNNLKIIKEPIPDNMELFDISNNNNIIDKYISLKKHKFVKYIDNDNNSNENDNSEEKSDENNEINNDMIFNEEFLRKMNDWHFSGSQQTSQQNNKFRERISLLGKIVV
jgi:hypothetical protein